MRHDCSRLEKTVEARLTGRAGELETERICMQ
jgi:hypothetical protein